MYISAMPMMIMVLEITELIVQSDAQPHAYVQNRRSDLIKSVDSHYFVLLNYLWVHSIWIHNWFQVMHCNQDVKVSHNNKKDLKNAGQDVDFQYSHGVHAGWYNSSNFDKSIDKS